MPREGSMTKNRWKSGEPDGTDIRNALKAFEEDLQLKARLMWYGGEETSLVVIVQVYRDINGERIGICQKRGEWEPGTTAAFTKVLQLIYFAYHEAETMAYGEAASAEAKRIAAMKNKGGKG